MVYHLCFLATAEIPGKNSEEGPYSSASCPKTTGKDDGDKNKYFLKTGYFFQEYYLQNFSFPHRISLSCTPKVRKHGSVGKSQIESGHFHGRHENYPHWWLIGPDVLLSALQL